MSVFAPRIFRYEYRTMSGHDGIRQLLFGVALNAAASARTIELDATGIGQLSVQVDYTYSSATVLTFDLYGSLNAGLSWAPIRAVTSTSTVGTLNDFQWQVPVTASTNAILDFALGSYDRVKLIIGGTGAGAGDLVTVYAKGSGVQ